MALYVDLARLIVGNEGQLYMRPEVRERFRDSIPYLQRASNGDPYLAALLAGIAWTESEFYRFAVNRISGASGFMQIMPFHFPRFGWVGANADGWNCRTENLAAALVLLREMGLGQKPIRQVLKSYGGFVTKDPSTYVDRVTTRAVYLFPTFFFAG